MTAHAARDDGLARRRREIERLDRAIVLLLAARLEAAGRAIAWRSARGREPTDPAQERRVLLRSRRWARDLGVPEELVERLFQTLIEEGKTRFRTGGAPSGPLPVTALRDGGPTATAALEGAARTKLVSVTPLR